ncbi:hypothetical protein FNV43_RR08056 [Rhamnella rubrinervis]|uniref:FLZ-type domain-containing protein n=1 Tax=Rhamnella rubrinervis TaxID=2594499 RepID=A0A8K0HGH5_9ROSA|nr:hypothetical protein FNV43_RR08056 [Rhamnella rubrinervis]
MLSRFRSPFKVGDQDDDDRLRKLYDNSHESRVKSSPVAVGLRILVQISQGKSNIVVKSAVRLTKPTTANSDYCFLKTCYLCNMGLSLDKEVYMYRGDQGFCSIECRNKQIVLDEMRELEASTKQMIASAYGRNCYNSTGRHETRILLDDLISHRHNKPIPRQRNTPILS